MLESYARHLLQYFDAYKRAWSELRTGSNGSTLTEEAAKEAGDKANDSYHGTVRDPRRTATRRVMFRNEGQPQVAKYVGDPGRMTENGMRSAGPTFQELVAGDSRPELVPDTLKEDSPLPGGVMKVSTDRFISLEFHDLEVEK